MKKSFALFGLLAGCALMSSSLSAEEKDEPFPKPDMGKIKEMFQKLDADGDGKLSLEEFAKFERMRGDGPPPGGGFGRFGGGKFDPAKAKEFKEKFGGKVDPEKLKEFKDKFGKKKDE